MSDLTMGKVKKLYEDMVAMEQNMASMEKRVNGNLMVLERRAAQHLQVPQPQNQSSAASSLKTVVAVASIAFGIGISFSPGAGISLVMAGIPVGMGVAWGIASYLEKGGNHSAKTIASKETEQIWTEEKIQSAFANLRPGVEERIQAACRDVLIHGLSVNAASAKQKIFHDQVERTIGRLIVKNMK